MQKKLIALALASLAGSAFAQSNVTVYGVADASFEFAKAEGATSVSTVPALNNAQNMNSRQRITSNSSYIGFKGAEELGNGLKALFQVETQIALDNAQDSSAGTTRNSFANRDSFVGLTGGFGTAVIGYLSTPHRNLLAGWDVVPGATGIAGNNTLMGKVNYGVSRAANGTTGNTFGANYNTIFRSQAIAYVTPTFSGFSGVLAYVPNEGKVTNTQVAVAPGVNTYENNASAWNLGLNYANGPIKVGYSYLDFKDAVGTGGLGALVVNDGSKVKSHLLAGSYTFPFGLTLGLAYNQNKMSVNAFNNANGIDAVKNNVWAINGKYVYGAHEFAAQYQRAADGSVQVNGQNAGNAFNDNERGATAWSLRYGYNLSKRSQVYAAYSEIKNKANGNYDFGSGTSTANQQAGISAGADPKAFAVGLRHSF